MLSGLYCQTMYDDTSSNFPEHYPKSISKTKTYKLQKQHAISLHLLIAIKTVLYFYFKIVITL